MRNSEKLFVVPQFRQPSLKERHVTVTCHLPDRHIAEPDDIDLQAFRDVMERFDDVGIRSAELDGFGPRHITCPANLETEVAPWHHNGGAVLTDERVADAQLLLDVCEFRSCFSGTQHQCDVVARELSKDARGDDEGRRVGTDQDVVHIRKNHD